MNCPHARGGEPAGSAMKQVFDIIVPTHVGVNRWTPRPTRSQRALSPRTWG